MISVSEAFSLISQNSCSLEAETAGLVESLGRISSKDIVATLNLPPFRQSAMDGYAFREGSGALLQVIGESKAGDNQRISLGPDEAIRIFTGAKVPAGVDTIVMQEHVRRVGDQITLDKVPAMGANIRQIGEQIRLGQVLVQKGTRISPPIIGLLASQGLTEVSVFRKVRVSLLVTGNELQTPGKVLKSGEVYESSSSMLLAAFAQENVEIVSFSCLNDDFASITEAIRTIPSSDLLLLTGGISVGDYDLVRDALLACEAKEIFYKINQKPGKPLWFGTLGETRIMALPGNPASTLTCYLVYARMLIRQMTGVGQANYGMRRGLLKVNALNTSGKALFLQGNESGGNLELYPKLASSSLRSFAFCNALIYIPEAVHELAEGAEVDYLSLNW